MEKKSVRPTKRQRYVTLRKMVQASQNTQVFVIFKYHYPDEWSTNPHRTPLLVTKDGNLAEELVEFLKDTERKTGSIFYIEKVPCLDSLLPTGN